MEKILILGASSGLGKSIAEWYIRSGHEVGIAARRIPELLNLKTLAPNRVFVEGIDITLPEAREKLFHLIEEMGGIETFILCSGVGFQNPDLSIDKELETTAVNVIGFTQMLNVVYTYFRQKGNGHIVVISSIAGTRGLGIAPSYSATKRFQSTYLDALEQLSKMDKLQISFTDIRPGFIKTPLLNNNKKYPLLMDIPYATKKTLSAIRHKKRVVIIDWRYAILVFFWKLIPNYIWKRLHIRTKNKLGKK